MAAVGVGGWGRVLAPRGLRQGLRAETPGGPMTNLGIHHVDTYRHLLGPIVRVRALVRRVALTGVLAHRGQLERTAVPLTTVDAIIDEPAEFARCVRDGTKPEVGGEEATANIAVLEAIVESGRTGHEVVVGG